MNIVYAVTRNVYHTILPSIKSLAAIHPDARVFVLAEDDNLPFTLPMPVEVINVSGQEYFPNDSVNYNNRFKYINLLKVRYPSILKVRKIIHLDTDTIVCDSLEPLWSADVDGKWFAACQEVAGTYKPFGPDYYNMGVALINLQQMRKDHIEEAMEWYLREVKQPWADQDAWNLFGMAFDKIAELPVRFNESIMTGMTDNPAIVHYCSITNWWDNKKMYRREYMEKWR